MWPCSPHLKHVGPFLTSGGFGGFSFGLIAVLWLVVFEFVLVVLLYLHGSLQPGTLVVLVMNWSTGEDVAPCNIELFSDGSYWSPPMDVVA